MRFRHLVQFVLGKRRAPAHRFAVPSLQHVPRWPVGTMPDRRDAVVDAPAPAAHPVASLNHRSSSRPEPAISGLSAAASVQCVAPIFEWCVFSGSRQTFVPTACPAGRTHRIPFIVLVQTAFTLRPSCWLRVGVRQGCSASAFPASQRTAARATPNLNQWVQGSSPWGCTTTPRPTRATRDPSPSRHGRRAPPSATRARSRTHSGRSSGASIRAARPCAPVGCRPRREPWPDGPRARTQVRAVASPRRGLHSCSQPSVMREIAQ
jgi:hypothetical protein